MSRDLGEIQCMSMEDDENSHDDTNDDLEVNTANDDAKPNVLQLMKCSWNRIYGTDRVSFFSSELVFFHISRIWEHHSVMTVGRLKYPTDTFFRKYFLKNQTQVRVIKKALEDSGPLTDTIDLDGIKAKMSSYTTIDDYLADIDDFIAKCKVRFKGEFFVCDYLF